MYDVKKIKCKITKNPFSGERFITVEYIRVIYEGVVPVDCCSSDKYLDEHTCGIVEVTVIDRGDYVIMLPPSGEHVRIPKGTLNRLTPHLPDSYGHLISYNTQKSYSE